MSVAIERLVVQGRKACIDERHADANAARDAAVLQSRRCELSAEMKLYSFWSTARRPTLTATRERVSAPMNETGGSMETEPESVQRPEKG